MPKVKKVNIIKSCCKIRQYRAAGVRVVKHVLIMCKALHQTHTQITTRTTGNTRPKQTNKQKKTYALALMYP